MVKGNDDIYREKMMTNDGNMKNGKLRAILNHELGKQKIMYILKTVYHLTLLNISNIISQSKGEKIICNVTRE